MRDVLLRSQNIHRYKPSQPTYHFIYAIFHAFSFISLWIFIRNGKLIMHWIKNAGVKIQSYCVHVRVFSTSISHSIHSIQWILFDVSKKARTVIRKQIGWCAHCTHHCMQSERKNANWLRNEWIIATESTLLHVHHYFHKWNDVEQNLWVFFLVILMLYLFTINPMRRSKWIFIPSLF